MSAVVHTGGVLAISSRCEGEVGRSSSFWWLLGQSVYGRNRTRSEEGRMAAASSARGWNCRHKCLPACLSRLSLLDVFYITALRMCRRAGRLRCRGFSSLERLAAEPSPRRTRSRPYQCACFMFAGSLIATSSRRVLRRPGSPFKSRRGSPAAETSRGVPCCRVFAAHLPCPHRYPFTCRSAVRYRASFARPRPNYERVEPF